MLLPSDPKAEFLAQEAAIRGAIERVLASGTYILGTEVAAFEAEFATYHGAAQCVAVANGTEALELALRGLGIRPGDQVATVANTVTATVAAIEQIGARPVFVEIDPDTMVMDPSDLERILARGTPVRAVVPVHLYGHPADMPRILALARRYGAVVVEDCAQAHGARFGGRKVGTFGEAAGFSFYPTKNLGALGDAGAIVTQSAEVADRLRRMRQYGWKERYVSDMPGRNSRLDEIQAAILRAKLPGLDAGNARRREHAAAYIRLLDGMPLQTPVVGPGAEHVFHQFVVRTPQRDALRAELARSGIHAGILYPVPIHRQPAFANPDLSLPVTERACAEVLSLPCHPAMGADEVVRVAERVRSFFVGS